MVRLRWVPDVTSKAHTNLATRLDKRAELIRERRYNTLSVANDPKVAYPTDGVATDIESAASEIGDDSTVVSSNGDNVAMSDESKLSSPSMPQRDNGGLSRMLYERSPVRGLGEGPLPPPLQPPPSAAPVPETDWPLQPPPSAAPVPETDWTRNGGQPRRSVSVGSLRARSTIPSNSKVIDAEQLFASNAASNGHNDDDGDDGDDSDGPPLDAESDDGVVG